MNSFGSKIKKYSDFKKLKGEELFLYLLNDHPDSDYAVIVEMLPYAVPNIYKAYEILESTVKDNKKLTVIYPEFDEEPSPKWEYVGEVVDGKLYISD